MVTACEDIVAAAREEEESQKSETAPAEGAKSVQQQGESLLPYLVDHLRSSLMLEQRSYSSQSSEEGTSVLHVEDSGTESGEDLRLLAGLRGDGQNLDNNSEIPNAELLTEVQLALDKLQESLNTGLESSKNSLDQTTRDTLLQLVSRLQSSLKLPPETNAKAPAVEMKSPNKNRFINRRLLRQNRHTVGVTREELADARRLLEEASLTDRVNLNLNKEKDGKVEGTTNLPPMPFATVKQTSAGDLMSGPNPAPLKQFRPVHFAPKSKAPVQLGNAMAKPFPFDNGRRLSEGDQVSSSFIQDEKIETSPVPAFVEAPVEVKIYEKPRITTAISHSSSSPPKKIKQKSLSRGNSITEGEDKLSEVGTPTKTVPSPPLKNIQYAPNVFLEPENFIEPKKESDNSRSSSRGSVEKEIPAPPVLLHSKSLNYDAPVQHPPVTQSLSVDSGSSLLEYDPSLRLFTPEQSVKIAVHKAAINKQLSQEEEKRMRKLSIESDLVSSDDEVLEDDGDVSSETEEEESTVKHSKSPKMEINLLNGYLIQANENPYQQDTLNNNVEKDPRLIENNMDVDEVKEKGQDLVRNFQKLSENFSFLKNFQGKEQGNYRDTSRFEKRIQEIQNERKMQNQRQNVRSIEELQKIYNDRKEKEKEQERKNLNDTRSQLIQNAQAKYQKTLATTQAVNAKVFNHQRQQLNPDIRSRYEQEIMRKEEEKPKITWIDPQRREPEMEYDPHQLEGDLPLDVSLTESEMSISSTSTENSISHAQRLLQLATNDKPTRFYGRSAKKLKMKRANTIDIPKPLNFYQVEDDTDYSEDEGRPDDKKSNPKQPPNLKPKTESDKKFLAFLNKESQPKITQAIWKKDQENVPPKPVFNKASLPNEKSLPNEHQWNNRFSKIKTTFENPVEKNEKKKKENAPMSSARAFWKTADDSVAVVKSNKDSINAANGARLSRQGSRFLKKLFQQKEMKEMEEKPVKLPWAGANNENVVVGSLTVCHQANQRKIFSPNEAPQTISHQINQKKLFSPTEPPPTISHQVNQRKIFSPPEPPQTISHQVNQRKIFSPPEPPPSISHQINQRKMFSPPEPPQTFSHQINQKKIFPPPEPPQTISHQVNQRKIFSPTEIPQKINQFSHAPMSAFRPVERKLDMEVQKLCNGRTNANQYVQDSKMPLSPPLPWTKDNGICSSLTSTVAKFEAREPSPVLIISKPKLEKVTRASPVRSLSRSPSQPSIVQARSQTFTPTYPNVTVNMPVQYQSYQPEVKISTNYPPAYTYSADVAATTTIYPEPEYEPTTPEEHVAIAKVMGSPIQQQAVTIKQKTYRREEEEDGRLSAAGHLANVLQRFSTPPDDKESESPKLLVARNSLPDIQRAPLLPDIQRATLLPPNLPTGKTSPTQISYNSISPRNMVKTYMDRVPSSSSRRTSSVESLVTTTSSEELRENGESVLTTRLQIPVYTPSNRTSSVQDLSPRDSPSSPSISPTSVLRKSESWHQLNGQIKPKRPQSLILPDLPAPQRRTPNSLLKTKSSHALGFAQKQFEAVMTPASVEIKQKTVEEYLSVKKIKKKEAKPASATKPHLVELDDNLENVDEAFDALFNSVTSNSSGKKGKRKPSDLNLTNSSVSAFNRTSAALSKSTSASAVQHFRNSK